MTRVARPVAAYAGVGVGIPGGGGGVATADESEDVEVEEEETQPIVPVVMEPLGSRFADVAKAAALKAERTIIEETLRQVRWNRRRAAEQLGVSYKTLLNKIKECGISRK